MNTHIGALSWPDPGLRALEFALAAVLGFCALVLRGSRWPSFPSLPQRARTDPLAVAWTSIRLRRPNVPEAGWALLGGVAAGLFVGGPAALPAGLIGTVGTFVWLARRRAKSGLRDKARLSAQVPPLADLFAAGLAAGLQPAQAAVTVAQAFGGDSYPGGGRAGQDASGRLDRSKLTGIDLLAYRFHDAATAVLAGADPQAAWSALALDEATAPLAAAVIRAGRTGAPAATTVARAARELREVAADALSAEVRTVGVRATAPLTLCFLPAFVFLGVLPTALGLLPRLRSRIRLVRTLTTSRDTKQKRSKIKERSGHEAAMAWQTRDLRIEDPAAPDQRRPRDHDGRVRDRDLGSMRIRRSALQDPHRRLGGRSTRRPRAPRAGARRMSG